MLKLVGAILLTGGGGWMGLNAAGELRSRIRALEAWQDALKLLRSELAFRLPDMPRLAATLIGRSREPVKGTFAALEKGLERLGEEPFEELWRAALTAHAGGLKEEDLELLQSLGSLLGRYGWEDQCRGLESVREELHRRTLQAREDQRQKGKAYGTLGLALGAFMTILLL